ncbi:MAG: glycosyltransferase family 2 protein [Acidimicrobiales bacterium]
MNEGRRTREAARGTARSLSWPGDSPLQDRVGAVIVNYNAGDYLSACVASLRSEGISAVVVVDNGSSDGSSSVLAAADAGARIIVPGRNLGYGRGVNRGLAELPGSELVLVGNPDIVVRPGAVAALVAALDGDPAIGLVGPRIEEPDGTLYPSARTFPNLGDSVGHGFVGLVAPDNRWSRRYKMADWDHASEREVDWVSGACFLARRAALDAIGGFDTRYFMFSEDVDLCWRAGRAGWRVAYEPAATVTHVKGVSVEHHPYAMIVAHHRSLLRFAARSAEGRSRALLPVVAAGLSVRTGLACLGRWGAGRWGAGRSD